MHASEKPANPNSGETADSNRPDGDSAPRRVNAPGELIAAIPAMLGFLPSRSLVVTLLTPATEHSNDPIVQSIGPVIRFDVDAAIDEQFSPRLTATVASISLRENAVAIMAVVIDDRPGSLDQADRVLQPLRALSARLSNAWFVKTITTYALYRDLLGRGSHGVVEDPAAAAVAFSGAPYGDQIRCSRRELVDMLAPDSGLAADVAGVIGVAFDRYRDESAAAIRDGRLDDHRRGAAEWVLDQVAAVTPNPPMADDLATLAAVLRDWPVRAIMFALATASHRDFDSAHMLWRHLARATTGTDRAGAAVLFGHSSYHGGHTTLAGIAFGEALRADPTHSTAQLLKIALREGIPPHEITQLAEAGHEVARALGVDIETTTT